ncbi:MAG: chloride channel protein [Verrucomicrobia bacterium]|nr:chloride channel protein [Verrucomicrobiota bacterium]
MHKVRDALLEVVIILLVGGLIGAVLAIVSNLFVMGVQWFGLQREVSDLLSLTIGGQTISFSSVLFLWAAAAVVVVLKTGFGIGRWAGPADSMYAAHQVNEPLDIKTGLTSTLAAFASASGGGSVGQYGPIVHFGATMGIWVKRFVSSRLSHEVYLGCGVAAAISAGFNAPIAGVIFAHEAILRHFSVRAIAPITVASVSASALGNQWFPHRTTFEISSVVPPLAEIVPVLVVLAPMFSLIAVCFMWALRYSAQSAAKIKTSPILLPFIAATICGLVGVWIPQILGLGISSINDMIAGEFALSLLLTVLIAKVLMTALCIGFGLFGGVFSPSLFIGVAAGALAGQLLVMFGFADIASIISVAGMAAVSSAVIGAPVSAVLIILELTQSYQYAVAVMIAVMVCSLITHRLFGHSIFDRQLLDRGIDLIKGREAIALSQQSIASFASQDYVRAEPTTTGNQLRQEMKSRGHTEAYVVDDGGQLLGKVSIYEAIECADGSISDFMDTRPMTLYAHNSLAEAMAKVSQFVGESLPVVNAETGKLEGSLAEGALFQAVIDVQNRARTLERT